jgi:hypothetical protein
VGEEFVAMILIGQAAHGLPFSLVSMAFHVIAFTMAQVRQGALAFQREMSTALREWPELKVYSASPFDLDERKRLRDRFGGDVVYFFNDAALEFCKLHDLDLKFAGEVEESQLPVRRTVVVGSPERSPGT